MVLANILILSQIAGHVILFILSLCIVTPMSMHLSEFSGHCLLFASGNWREDDGLFDAQWASRGFCEFPIVTGVFLFLLSIAQIYRYSRMACKEEENSFIGLFLDVVAATTTLAMSVLSAIMITLGFIIWCQDMTERFPSCEIAAGQNITREDEHIDTSRFYIEMGTAQFGAWGAFAITVGIAVISFLKLINNHQIQNMKVSMYLERQRLVNEYAQGPSSDGQTTPPVERVSNN